MRNNYGIASLFAVALLVSAYLTIPAAMKASQSEDSINVTKLLAEAKAEAVELLQDSVDLESFTRSKLSWMSHIQKIEMVKEHVNNSGKLLAKLKDAKGAGSPWQQAAINRIEPLLREFAANTGTTIDYLNENRAQVHLPELQEYVRGNYEMAVNLEALIRDFVNYGEAKQEFERLRQKVGITG